MMRLEPCDLYPGCLLKPGETMDAHVLPENRERRQRAHRKAVELLRDRLKPGDRIFAVRGECCARYAWYSFAGWDRTWIITASGINTIIPASVRCINSETFKIENYLKGGAA